MPDLYHQRADSVRKHFEKWGIDALLLLSPANRRWLTGFTGSLGYAVVTADKVVLATDGRYWSAVAAECSAVELYKYKREPHAMKQFIESLGVERLGIEAGHVTLDMFGEMRPASGVEWVPLKTTVEELRNVKTAAEVELIRRAAQITDLAMSQVNEIVKPGMTEKALAWELEKIMRTAGADELAFDIIVASGVNGARPHHNPSDYAMAVGDTITIDMGAKLDGYHSDLTRAFYLGNEPDEQFKQVYATVLAAEEMAIKATKAGMTGKGLDTIARDHITEAGYGDYFLHSLGHGVGLEIHEQLSLSVRNDEPIPAGATVTIEPGIYIEGWSGIRIEDLILVTEDGCEVISQAPKNPIIPV